MLGSGILADFNPLVVVQSEPVFTLPAGPWKIVVSNHMFMIGVASIIMMIWLPLAVWRRRSVPSGLPNMVEAICVYLREQMAMPCLKEHTDRYIGFVWTLFFFILTLNILGMIPSEHIIYLLTGKKNHFGGAATANIWVTGALSVLTFFVIHISGMRQQGIWHYIKNFAPHVPWVLMPLIYFIELISAVVRQIALAIRLFANMLAGHVAMATFLGLIVLFWHYGFLIASATTAFSLGIGLFLSLLDLLIAFLQAYIFAFLVTLFISFAIAPEH